MSVSAKNNILKKIRTALAHPTPLPFPKSEGADIPVQPQQQDLVVEFAEQFSALQGKFIFCLDDQELKESFEKLRYQNQWTALFCIDKSLQQKLDLKNLHPDLDSCEASVTGCEYVVARTGSLVLSPNNSGRTTSVYAPIHICIAYTSQLVYDIKDALDRLNLKYKQNFPSLITLATGPSRTADIEKTLVVGVHGPKEVYCFIVDDTEHTA
jgi:L-lactate dehydrogenase complex protein LldG